MGRSGYSRWVRMMIAGLLAGVLMIPGQMIAGSISPSGPPGPTMKTLDEIPPTWSQRLDSTNGDPVTHCNSTRFECIWDGVAVLDKETGLVWERTPSSTPQNFVISEDDCYRKEIGSRKGWRLPVAEELSTLSQYYTADYLPAGHPFTNIQAAPYYTATTRSSTLGTYLALTVDFSSGSVGIIDKANAAYYWCVRGGHGTNGVRTSYN